MSSKILKFQFKTKAEHVGKAAQTQIITVDVVTYIIL